jgi:hypothetical protein
VFRFSCRRYVSTAFFLPFYSFVCLIDLLFVCAFLLFCIRFSSSRSYLPLHWTELQLHVLSVGSSVTASLLAGLTAVAFLFVLHLLDIKLNCRRIVFPLADKVGLIVATVLFFVIKERLVLRLDGLIPIDV